jgi:hypothetical protein
METSQDLERTARRRAAIKLGWLVHAAVYLAVNAVLALLAFAAGRNWVIYPALGWGLGLLIHGAVVFIVTGGGGLYGQMVEHERTRLQLQRDPW